MTKQEFFTQTLSGTFTATNVNDFGDLILHLYDANYFSDIKGNIKVGDTDIDEHFDFSVYQTFDGVPVSVGDWVNDSAWFDFHDALEEGALRRHLANTNGQLGCLKFTTEPNEKCVHGYVVTVEKPFKLDVAYYYGRTHKLKHNDTLVVPDIINMPVNSYYC